MTDDELERETGAPGAPEDRIAKLQKLLDGVITRRESELPRGAAGDEGGDAHGAEGEADEPNANTTTTAPAPADLVRDEASPDESRARLAADGSDGSGGSDDAIEELSEDELVPESQAAVALPLVRRSRPVELPPEDLVSEEHLHVAARTYDPSADDEVPSGVDAEEILSSEIEDAPTSSRRPIANESLDDLDDLAEEEYSAPRHTPPPESGRQIAAPIMEPEVPVRRSSAPAVPDVMRADLPPDARVAGFTGVLPTPRPETFGELLDESLAL